MHKTLTSVRRGGLAALALITAGAAQAHPGHADVAQAGSLLQALATGLAHPFSGFDHLLAMAAVGLWSAAALPAGRRLAGPAVFLALLLVGAALPHAGWMLPGLEAAVAISVVALAALMVAARHPAARLPVPAGLALVGLAAALHGMAHGAELAAGQSFAGYALGFMTASALLHGAGLTLGGWLQRSRAWAWRASAAFVGASGVAMLAGRL